MKKEIIRITDSKLLEEYTNLHRKALKTHIPKEVLSRVEEIENIPVNNRSTDQRLELAKIFNEASLKLKDSSNKKIKARGSFLEYVAYKFRKNPKKIYVVIAHDIECDLSGADLSNISLVERKIMSKVDSSVNFENADLQNVTFMAESYKKDIGFHLKHVYQLNIILPQLNSAIINHETIVLSKGNIIKSKETLRKVAENQGEPINEVINFDGLSNEEYNQIYQQRLNYNDIEKRKDAQKNQESQDVLSETLEIRTRSENIENSKKIADQVFIKAAEPKINIENSYLPSDKIQIKATIQDLEYYAKLHRKFLINNGGLSPEEKKFLNKLENKNQLTKEEIESSKILYIRAEKYSLENEEIISKKIKEISEKLGLISDREKDIIEQYNARGTFNDYIASRFAITRGSVTAVIEADQDDSIADKSINFRLLAANLDRSVFSNIIFDNNSVDSSTKLTNCQLFDLSFNLKEEDSHLLPDTRGSEIKNTHFIQERWFNSTKKPIESLNQQISLDISADLDLNNEKPKEVKTSKIIKLTYEDIVNYSKKLKQDKNITLREFIKAQENEIVVIQGLNIVNKQNNGINLENANFSNVKFIDSSFVGVNMNNVNFDNANIIQCRFEECNLEKTNFIKTNLTEVVFNSNIADQNISQKINPSMQQSVLIGKNIRLATLEEVKKYAEAKQNSAINMSFSEFIGADANTIISVKDLDLKHLNFKNCDFSNVIFENVNFEKSIFEGAILNDAEMVNCRFKFADFSNSTIQGANFERCNLKEVNFKNANLKATNFGNQNDNNSTNTLRANSFEGADLLDTKFHNNMIVDEYPNFNNAVNAEKDNFSNFSDKSGYQIPIDRISTLACAQLLSLNDRYVRKPTIITKTIFSAATTQMMNPANLVTGVTAAAVGGVLTTALPVGMTGVLFAAGSAYAIQVGINTFQETKEPIAKVYKAENKADLHHAEIVSEDVREKQQQKFDENYDKVTSVIKNLMPSKSKLLISVGVGIAVATAVATVILTFGTAVPAIAIGASVSAGLMSSGVLYTSHDIIKNKFKSMFEKFKSLSKRNVSTPHAPERFNENYLKPSHQHIDNNTLHPEPSTKVDLQNRQKGISK